MIFRLNFMAAWTPFEEFSSGIKDALSSVINSIVSEIQTDLGSILGSSSSKLSMSPQAYNSTIFNMVKNFNKTVIIPIAAIIMTYVLAYELIQMLIEKNNMAEFDNINLIKWLFKAYITIELLAHSWEITMGFFDVGVYIVSKATGITSRISMTSPTLSTSSIASAGVGELLLCFLEAIMFKFIVKGMSIAVSVFIIYRMVEIYIYSSACAIPYSTLGNGELKNIGTGYIKTMLGLAFQGFFMLLILAIFSVLAAAEISSGEIFKIFPKLMIYFIILFLGLKKSGSISKDIFTGN